jgi:HK97 family phage portal protein
MVNPIKKIFLQARKSLAITMANGARLLSGGYRGDFKNFFTELSYGESDSGISITNEKALNYTAFWSCVTLLAGDVASLPLPLYRRKCKRGRERAIDHPLYFLLHDEPNPEMDSFSYIEKLMYNLVANNGNCYSYIDWSEDRTEIKALWPMNPDKVTKIRDEKTREIQYLYQLDNGQVTLPAYHVWHIPGFGFDGLMGCTPLTYARNLIGLGLGAEKMGSKLFSNGLTFGGFLEHPNRMSEPARENWEKTIKEKHEGVEKAHRLFILEEGMHYNKNNISPEDAQMLETRKFERTEMASFFHIPPHKIGDLERATFSNIEEQNIEYVQHTLRRWLVRFERSAKRQLLLPHEKGDYYMEFLVDSLLRGNMESRYRAHAIGRNWGWLTPNRIAEMENMEPIPEEQGGDKFLQPANMMTAEDFDKTIPKPGGGNATVNK